METDFNDEHAGKGGSYVADPDGKRVLQKRTGMVVSVPAEPEAKPAKSTVKGDRNA